LRLNSLHRPKQTWEIVQKIKYAGVDVKTFKGTVQLSGFVENRAQKSRAADLAKGVEGVKEVENNILIKD